MRKLVLGLCLLLMASGSPARAEVAWFDFEGTHLLSGAQLLRLRDELSPTLQENLKQVRNIVYDDVDAFRGDLTELLPTEEDRRKWLDRLTALAAAPGAAYGVEPRGEGVTTITVAAPDHVSKNNPFLAQSWLTALPEPSADTALTTTLDGNCLAVTDGNAPLFSLCTPQVADHGTTVVLKTDAGTVRGLGQQFSGEETTADWIGGVRDGFNVMAGFNGGANGNTLFPIAYFDAEPKPFALILDNRTQQSWDFSEDDFRIRTWGGDFTLHVLTGDTLADVRRQYMTLTGRPPIPPKSAFGLWISEYGYENWAELDEKIATLRENGFPLSGAVLDLYWFGGIRSNSPDSQMGSLRWDEERFPDPAARIAAYKADGIDIMLIEESYISENLPEFAALAEIGGLVKNAEGVPQVVNPAGNWWGKGGMVDWTVPEARDFWHDFRRQPLIDMGVAGHWTDLGEPEMIHPAFVYGADAIPEATVHNSYNLLWLQGIADGYARNSPDRRPFLMSRSGGMGMQRLGAAMWSGDTGSDFSSLAAQMPNQTHMMWSGLDYYGSDVGGFHRGALGVYPGAHDEVMDELYTQWFAYSAMFEVPVRPHTENLCNCKETAPDRIGDLASNRANLRLRDQLTPYYYSLAYAAWHAGEPVFPSVDYWFPDAAEARELGHEKMIGPSLLSAAVAEFGAEEVEMYVPAGTWYVVATGATVISSGEMMTFPVYNGELFQLPLLARDGAVIPIKGDVLNVYGDEGTWFEWFDDDGVSQDYKTGGYDLVRVLVSNNRVQIHRGSGFGIQPRELRWYREDFTPVASVTINGTAVPFTQTNGKVVVALPNFSDRLVVALE